MIPLNRYAALIYGLKWRMKRLKERMCPELRERARTELIHIDLDLDELIADLSENK
jgi:hypothetical protein